MNILLSFMYVLLQANSNVATIIKVFLIHFTTVVFIHVPAMKHTRDRTALFFFHAREDINVKPVLKRCPDLVKIIKSLFG